MVRESGLSHHDGLKQRVCLGVARAERRPKWRPKKNQPAFSDILAPGNGYFIPMRNRASIWRRQRNDAAEITHVRFQRPAIFHVSNLFMTNRTHTASALHQRSGFHLSRARLRPDIDRPPDRNSKVFLR